jgi:ribosomal-protein-alanine N-acetyltransferase
VNEKTGTPATMDAYIQSFPIEIQKIMQELRYVIQTAAPEATEKISYQMPTFYLYGNLVHFAAHAHHIGFYPGSSGIANFQNEFQKYHFSKGAVQFPLEKELPWDLITRIVAFRREENIQEEWKRTKKYTFTPFPVLKTPRLILRAPEAADADDLYSMRKDPAMAEFTDSIPDQTITDTEKYIEKMNQGVLTDRWVVWAIESKETHRVIGSISLWNLDPIRKSGELGFGIHPAEQGKGLMKEALLAVLDYGFKKMRLATIEAYTEEENERANALLRSCRFLKVDQITEKGMFKQRDFVMNIYQIQKKRGEEQ